MTGQEVKDVKAKLGLTWRVFALLVGVGERHIKAWGAGEYPPSGHGVRSIEMILFLHDHKLLNDFMELHEIK